MPLGAGFNVSEILARCRGFSFFPLPVDLDVELSDVMPGHYAPDHEHN